MTDRRDEITAELDRGLSESVTFFKSLSLAELQTQVYQDGAQWTVQQVLAHFIAIERSMLLLFKDILAGGQGTPPDFDLDRFNLAQTRKYDGLTIDELIERFKAVRQETTRIVRDMKEEDLDREGMHAFHGKGKLGRFIRWAYEHTRIHEGDICKELGKALGPLAHVTEEGSLHSLREHLIGTAERAAEFADEFGFRQWAGWPAYGMTWASIQPHFKRRSLPLWIRKPTSKPRPEWITQRPADSMPSRRWG